MNDFRVRILSIIRADWWRRSVLADGGNGWRLASGCRLRVQCEYDVDFKRSEWMERYDLRLICWTISPVPAAHCNDSVHRCFWHRYVAHAVDD